MPQALNGLRVVSFESRRSAEMAELIRNYGGERPEGDGAPSGAEEIDGFPVAHALGVIRGEELRKQPAETRDGGGGSHRDGARGQPAQERRDHGAGVRERGPKLEESAVQSRPEKVSPQIGMDRRATQPDLLPDRLTASPRFRIGRESR